MATSCNTSEDFMKCSICLSPFTLPRMLNCLHTFCLPCLEKLTENVEQSAKVKCPLCRSEVPLPMNGLAGLESPDFLPLELNQLTNEDTSLTVCQVCDSSREAFVKCIDCNENLCNDCYTSHGKFKAMKDHKLEFLKTNVRDCDLLANEQCKEHNIDLTLFCKPCNSCTCAECQKMYHNSHDVISLLDEATIERNILIAGIRGLKSKLITAIEATIEEAKVENDNFSKHCTRIKQQIRAHATGLKEVFSRNVDLAMNAKIAELEKLKKAKIKKVEFYIDKLETDKLSLTSVLRTSDSIIDRCNDAQIVKASPKLRLRLADMNKYESIRQEIHEIKYESGQISDEEISNIVGSLNMVLKTTLGPTFRQLPIPELSLVKKFSKVNSFDTEDDIKGIVGGVDSNAWILHDGLVCLYSDTGDCEYDFDEYDIQEDQSKLLKNQDGTIYSWGVNSATKIDGNSSEELYKVSFENGIAGCFLSNNNLVVYRPDDITFYEVNLKGEVQRKVSNEQLSNVIYYEPINMIETSDKNWVIVQKSRIITLRPDGVVQNIVEKKFNILPSVCSDRYGNVLLASSTGQSWNIQLEILLRSQDGLRYDQIHRFQSSIDYPKHMTVDGHGRLWCTKGDTKIDIYSYM